MKYSVLTSFNEKYWNEIGYETVAFLDNNWAANESISLYHELKNIPTSLSNRCHWIDLYQSCPDLIKFINQWKDHPNANGIKKGFRSNAIKFVHKTFAIWDAVTHQKDGWLIWLDVDALVHKKVNKTFLEKVCPENYMISFMGRPGKYSECGWIGFNLSHPCTKKFIAEWENLYLSGDFISLPETHDSWTFDYIRQRWEQPELFFNVNKDAKTNKNPFAQSLIGSNIVHAKGSDKEYLINRFKNRLL